MIISVDAEHLAAELFAEAKRHPARSRERRAAAHAWSALVTSPSIAAAQRAIRTFGDQQTQSDAAGVLHRVAASQATTTQGG